MYLCYYLFHPASGISTICTEEEGTMWGETVRCFLGPVWVQSGLLWSSVLDLGRDGGSAMGSWQPTTRPEMWHSCPPVTQRSLAVGTLHCCSSASWPVIWIYSSELCRGVAKLQLVPGPARFDWQAQIGVQYTGAMTAAPKWLLLLAWRSRLAQGWLTTKWSVISDWSEMPLSPDTCFVITKSSVV